MAKVQSTANKGEQSPGHRYAMINDAVHGVMSFPEEDKELLKALIDSDTFQRLRHIKQLGMTDLIFPTAVHNRFSHCLGAANVACLLSNSLLLEEDQKKYAMVGALLHDIGHGPFSHAFEKVLENEKSEKIGHESWTKFFLKEFEDQLDRHGIDYKILSNIIQKKYDMSGKYNIAADIVSSQLDVDRLDYLLRDAHFCGVPYGNPDIMWIINHATIVQETAKPPRLGFLRKGWRAIEHFLLCRRMMTQNVYHHHKKNVLEELMVKFLLEIAKDNKLQEKIVNTQLKKFLKNADDYRQGKVSKDGFMYENFQYYKILTDYDIWMLIRDFAGDSEGSVAYKIAQRIYQRKIHHSFRFEETCLGAVDSIVECIKKDLDISNWQIFTIKNDVLSYEAQEDPILVVDDNKAVHRIQKYSYLLSNLGDKYERESYLVIDIDFFEEHKDTLKKEFKKYISF